MQSLGSCSRHASVRSTHPLCGRTHVLQVGRHSLCSHILASTLPLNRRSTRGTQIGKAEHGELQPARKRCKHSPIVWRNPCAAGKLCSLESACFLSWMGRECTCVVKLGEAKGAGQSHMVECIMSMGAWQALSVACRYALRLFINCIATASFASQDMLTDCLGPA